MKGGVLIVNIKDIGEFYKEFVTSEDFNEDLQNKIRYIRDELEYRKFISKYVLPIASAKGYEFSVDDILKYETLMLNSLSEEDLANVAGGRSFVDGKMPFVPGLMLISRFGDYMMV